MTTEIRIGKIYQLTMGLALLFLGIFVGNLTAFGQDKSNGCGIGWYFTKDKTILASSMRSSSNSTSPNSISMTSGTSGCAEHDIVEVDKRTEHFVEANFDALRQDIAAGHGEYLASLSETLGCRWQVLPVFAETTRANYSYLFYNKTPDDAAETIGKIRQMLGSHPYLSQYCEGA